MENEEEVLETTNTPVEEETETIVDESTQEQPKVEAKTFTQDEVNSMIENRLNRERKRMERENKESLSKYQELAYLTQQGLKAESLEDTLNKSREFYGKQGITYVPSNNDDEIVGKAYADEIISESDSIKELEDNANRLKSKGNLTNRDKVIINNLESEILNRKRIEQLEAIGVSADEYNSKEFKDFEKQFTKETPITNVYEIYKKNTTKEVVNNPGSMKSVPGKEKKDFISEAEYDRMTDKEIEENMELIHKSMEKW